MSITLTQAEIDALLAERERLLSSVQKRQDSIDAQDDVVQAATDADEAQKKAFDLYDQDIIGNYNSEREALTGEYVEDPVLKSELDALGQLDASNRMFPTLPDTEPVRISQFDGTPLITTDNEITGIPQGLTGALDTEPYWLDRQGEREDWLVNGFGGTSPTITPTTFISTAVTTDVVQQITVETTDENENAEFQVGDTFVAFDGSNQVGFEVISIISQVDGDPDAGTCSDTQYTDQTTCENNGETWTSEPTTYEAVLEVANLTGGSIASGGEIDETWSGFSNADRTAKVDSTDGYTNMLTDLIGSLELAIDNRITKLNEQKTALENNEDPNLDSQALIDVNNSLQVLNDWKVDTDVDDSELSTLSSERSSRSTQITNRITAINTAYTSPTNFYDKRYTEAVNVADTSRGTARIKFFRINSQGVTQDLKQAEEDRITSIENLLTLAGVSF